MIKKSFLWNFLIAGTLLLIGCGNNTTNPTTATDMSTSISNSQDGGLVKVEALKKTAISRTVNYTATVAAFEELQVAPASVGRIDAINVEVGDHVKAGTTLFAMDKTTFVQAQIQLASLAVDLARLDTLLQKGSISKQTYDQMKTQCDVAKSNVDFLAKNVEMVAPFDGIITGRYYEAGELYSGSPSAASNGKSAIVTLQQINLVKVIVNVSERFFNNIKKGMKIPVTADVLSGEEFMGTVSLVYPTIDATSRSFKVEITIPNNAEKLRPGMFVRVKMDLGEEDVFAVHSNAVLMQEGTSMRYLYIEENGVARRVNVSIGDRYDDMIEIVSDQLKEGDNLIIEGQSRLSTGSKVTVVE